MDNVNLASQKGEITALAVAVCALFASHPNPDLLREKFAHCLSTLSLAGVATDGPMQSHAKASHDALVQTFLASIS